MIFNANPGDTLLLDIPYNDPYIDDTSYRVVIDTVLIEEYNAVELEKYILEQIDDFGWLYGFYWKKVGGYEWFLPLGLFTIPEHDGPIRCYQDNEIEINFTSHECDYRIVNSVVNLIADRFNLSPNPTSDFIRVKTDLKIDNIEVINCTGEIILKTSDTFINTGSYSRGVYFVRIFSGNYTIVKKIIIN